MSDIVKKGIATSILSMANGVRWCSIPREYTNTTSIVVFIKGGIHRESSGNSGIGSLFMRTWLKSGSFMKRVEILGGFLNGGLSHDYLEFSLSTPTMRLDDLIDGFCEQISTTKLDKDIFELEKYVTLQELEAEKDDPNSVAYQEFMSATYKDHPYALKSDGTIDTVSNLTMDDIESYQKDHFSTADMIVVMSGKYNQQQEKRVQDIFARLPRYGSYEIGCSGSSIVEDSRVTSVDERIQQAKLFVAYTAPSAGSEEYVYTKVLAELLGGGMSSAYFTALRKERGFAYSVSSIYPSRLCDSRFIGYIGLQQDNIEEAITVMQGLNRSIFDTIDEEGMEKVKNHIIGQVLVGSETNKRVAWYAAFFENLGLGFEYLASYIDILRTVEIADLRKMRYIFDKPCTIYEMLPPAKVSKQ